MIETIKGLCKAEGFLTAIAAVAADREMCGDQRDSFTMNDAQLLADKIDYAVQFIIGQENEIKRLRREIKDWEDLHTDADTQAAIDAGR